MKLTLSKMATSMITEMRLVQYAQVATTRNWVRLCLPSQPGTVFVSKSPNKAVEIFGRVKGQRCIRFPVMNHPFMFYKPLVDSRF